MGKRFVIQGGKKLSGSYRVQGNKNAALPIIAASLLAASRVRLKNVPVIEDVKNLLATIEALGVSVAWEGGDLCLDPAGLEEREPPRELVERLRGSILLLGVLGSRFGSVACALPGGCPIGKRSFESHWRVFEAAGFSVTEDADGVRLVKTHSVRNPRVYLRESSVTATESALILFSALGGGIVENPAREPHVLSLVDFLRSLGGEIKWHPHYFEVRCGLSGRAQEVCFTIPGDYIDAGTVAIAAAATKGRVELTGVVPWDLIGLQSALEDFGISFQAVDFERIGISVPGELASPSQVQAGLWPSFPTDLISLVIVLATQSRGLCLIHDWLYESRMFFVDKLIRMGAHVTMCDPHRVIVEGPTSLRGVRLESPDIRAGMALVVAGLCASGETTIELGEVIERGYERVAGRFRAIGAQISEEPV